MKPSESDSSASELGTRLTSVDALRGFDMFWILGGDLAVRALQKIHDSAVTQELANQMEHCDWTGFHFYDLIFPMFVFIVGVSIIFSVPKMIERDGYVAAVKRIVVRSIVLFLLGIFYMGGVANGFKNVYLAGVLHRIAVAYFLTALIFCLVKKYRAPADSTCGLIAVILLAGYWALMMFVRVPGIGAPTLAEPGKNLAHYIDLLYLPGKKFEGTLLSTMAAVANCLLGVLAGLLLKDKNVPDQQKVFRLLGGGVVSLAVGFIWATEFPIIKLLWTSTYVLVACGYSAILLAVFFQIIDIWKFQKWAQPFIWIGMNAITIYIIANIVGFRKLAERFAGGNIAKFLGRYSDLILAIITIALALAVVRFLYRRRIFLRL